MSALPSTFLVALCLSALGCAAPAAPASPASETTAPARAAEEGPPVASASASHEGAAVAALPPVASASASNLPPPAAPPSPPPPPPSRATLNGVSLSEASVDDIGRAFRRNGWITSVAKEHVSQPLWQVGRYEQLNVRVLRRAPNGREIRAFGVILTRPAKVAAPVVPPTDATTLEPKKVLAAFDSAILDLPYYFDEQAQVLVAGLPVAMSSREVQGLLDSTIVKPR